MISFSLCNREERTYTDTFNGEELSIFVFGVGILAIDDGCGGVDCVADEEDWICGVPAKWTCSMLEIGTQEARRRGSTCKSFYGLDRPTYTSC